MKLLTRANTSTVRKTIRIYVEEMRHDRRNFWLGMVLIPVSHMFNLVLIPLSISFIIQGMVEGASITQQLWLLGAIFTASILGIATNQIGFSKIFHHEETIVSRLVDRAMAALLAHSQQFFANHKVGSLANDVNTFSRSYLTLLDTIIMQASSIVVSYIASLIVIAFIAPILLIPLFLLTAFVIWHGAYSMSERSVYRNKRKELQSQLVGQIADVLGNQTLVRLFGKKHQELEEVNNRRHEIHTIATKEIQLIQRNAWQRQAVLFTFQLLVVAGIIALFEYSLIGVGASIFVITYLARVTSTMFSITGIIRGIEQSFLDAAKITEILEITPDVRDAEHATPLKVQSGRISFDSIDFSYSDAVHEKVFQAMDLEIEAHTRIGLVGKSGGGKTTLTSLLLRYIDVTDGEIYIDGQAITNVTQDSLRNAIAFVPQEPYLFHRTLRENIAYGKDGASDHEIIEAAKRAHAWEFIEKLPQGLDTVVGERGVKLSGGQRQRIAIARAILKDAPILVLDEATSALDSESEKLIQESLNELMKGRTSIVIAHRLSTLKHMDRIIVLDDGQIIEDGSHDELVDLGGLYSTLWKHQSGGFISE